MKFIRPGITCLILSLTVLACDTVQPEKTGLLVVEAYFNANKPLPRIVVNESGPIDAGPVGSATESDRIPVRDAVVTVTHNDIDISFIELQDSAGVYRPPDGFDLILQALDRIKLSVVSDGREATGTGMIPAPVSIADVSIIAPDRAIEAVLIDSLNLGIDSLNVAIIASEGYIFPVQVELTWLVPDGNLGVNLDVEDFWIQTRLDPVNKFSSSLLDFFLLSEQVLPEYEIEITTDPVLGRIRRWTGLYAVPVAHENDVIPPHELKVTLLRSGPDYARLITTANEPDRRSPAGNVTGGIGFIGGISVDSLRIPIQ